MAGYDYSSNGYDSVDRTHNKNNWNLPVSDKKDNSALDPSEFLTLMVAQMKNQDFTDPMDTTQYVTQMAQFSSMQQMTQMSTYSKTSYAMSLVGKNVTVSRLKFNGDLETETGPVDKVSLVNNEFILYVNGKKYTIDQVMEVQNPSEKGQCVVNPSNMSLMSSDIKDTSAVIKWNLPTEDTAVSKKLKYTVYYSTDGPFNSVEEVEKGTQSGSQISNTNNADDLTRTIDGLKPGTTYYVNVVVEDENGNKAVYKASTVSTKQEKEKV